MKNIAVVRRKALLWAILIMILPMLGACQKQEVNNDELKCPVTAKEGPDDNIIGKWKFVKTRTAALAAPSKTYDYSCNNVIFHFKEDGLLVISGVSEGIRSFGNGEYSFEFKDVPFFTGMDGTYTITIGYISGACSIQENKMIIDRSPLDGDRQYFVRVL